MSEQPVYLIDADVLIAAKDLYYAFDICPGFWASVLTGYQRGALRSIDPVRGEIMNGRPDDKLVQWIRDDMPNDFFLDCSADADVVTAFGEIMEWVQNEPQFFNSAKAEFATKADGWLAAYAMVHGVTIATNELANPDVKKEVKLGNVCEQFGVGYENTFSMLRRLQVRFEYGG